MWSVTGWMPSVFPCSVRYGLAHEMRSATGTLWWHTCTQTELMGGSRVLRSAAVCLISTSDLTFDRCVSIDHQLASGEGLPVSRSSLALSVKQMSTD